MIRDANKIYGEVNDPNTVLASANLTANSYIVGDGNKGIREFRPGANRILISDASGNLTSISHMTANQAIATNSNGDIVLVNREVW